MNYQWKCPQCGMNERGCTSVKARRSCKAGGECPGFVCECDQDSKDHGLSHADACTEANCYHCGWVGTFPPKPKGLQAWEKKAIGKIVITKNTVKVLRGVVAHQSVT